MTEHNIGIYIGIYNGVEVRMRAGIPLNRVSSIVWVYYPSIGTNKDGRLR